MKASDKRGGAVQSFRAPSPQACQVTLLWPPVVRPETLLQVVSRSWTPQPLNAWDVRSVGRVSSSGWGPAAGANEGRGASPITWFAGAAFRRDLSPSPEGLLTEGLPRTSELPALLTSSALLGSCRARPSSDFIFFLRMQFKWTDSSELSLILNDIRGTRVL